MDWIAVALSQDIPNGTVVPRRVCETDLAIWCSASGEYHAWGDRCPHRGMRLSHGFVRAETLACIYHGWQYDEAGACSYIPAHPKLTPPKTICAQTYACRNADGVIWVALEGGDMPLPETHGRAPVRSMEINVAAEALIKQLGGADGQMIVLDGAQDIAVSVQPSTAATSVMHVMAGADQDFKHVSRYMEDLRSTLEAHP
ncbi:MAG: Rieske (2Fe-2S) protein [Sulfitobacter sp.]